MTEANATLTPFGAEVLKGLGTRPRTLSPWLFYDERGSALFEQITDLPEYYLTRTERAIFAAHAREIVTAAAGGRELAVLELGAGTGSKTGLLLRAAVESQGGVDYYPIDVSASALAEAGHLESTVAGVRVHPRVADYTEGMGGLDADGRRKLVLYIGSSIGNFQPAAAAALLRSVRRELAPSDCLLLGVDLVKDLSVLLPAYNDAAGVTAAFNKNVLARLNRELGANFALDQWTHQARWNARESRIEMHLRSTRAQSVSIPALDLAPRFDAGEEIHTENSYKFTPERVRALLADSGFAEQRVWTDEHGWFAVTLAKAV